MKQVNYIYLGILFFVLFLLFSALVVSNNLYALDRSALLLAQASVPSFFITPFSIFSILGTFEVSVMFLVLVLFLLKGVSRLGVFILFGLTVLVETIGKKYIAQIAPPREFLLTNLHVGLPTGTVAGELFAYPSGHAARTAFISGFLLLFVLLSPKIKKQTKYLIAFGIIIFDFVMFLSRFYLAEHWFSDVVGGAFLGFSLAFFSSYFINLKSSK